MTCDLCQRDTGEMNFNQVCCRVRYLMRMPSRQLRAEWLDRWRKMDRVMADRVEAEVRNKFMEKVK